LNSPVLVPFLSFQSYANFFVYDYISNMYILILSFLFFRGISATCYRPDYALQTNPVFMACDSRQGQISSCCALNRTSDTGPVPRDICLPNGLCQNIATISGQTQVTYWRGSCSDNSWPKEDCLMGVCMGASVRQLSIRHELIAHLNPLKLIFKFVGKWPQFRCSSHSL
jgi:hypothetical protein